MKKDAVVLFPGFGMGHLIPTVELAKLFIPYDISVTVVLIDPPLPASSISTAIDSFVSRVSSAYPLISFHRLPKLQPLSPPPSGIVALVFDLFRLSNPLLSDFLTALSQTYNIRALILDMFCSAALDVAHELRLPAYIFFTTAASNLAAFLFLPKLQSELNANFKDLRDDHPLCIPGLPPFPASDMPEHLQDRDDEASKTLLLHFEQLPKADGILINTFERLEPRAVQALSDGLCVQPGGSMPPIYCIGPLIADESGGDGEEKHECFKWLDEQPKRSVVFLCFGSAGSFSAEQMKEIAIGLERSGQRFLWVVRSPRSEDPAGNRFEPMPEPDDLSLLMPEGFLERTEGRGMLVKSWAPQTAVLGHEAVGGFVSHCGWNSTLEAVRAGVPLIAWPLYAEQRMNKVFLVEEAELAVEMKGYDKEMVTAAEVETKIKWLTESEGGRALKARTAAMKESAEAAWKDGGSSDEAWKALMKMLC